MVCSRAGEEVLGHGVQQDTGCPAGGEPGGMRYHVAGWVQTDQDEQERSRQHAPEHPGAKGNAGLSRLKGTHGEHTECGHHHSGRAEAAMVKTVHGRADNIACNAAEQRSQLHPSTSETSHRKAQQQGPEREVADQMTQVSVQGDRRPESPNMTLEEPRRVGHSGGSQLHWG